MQMWDRYQMELRGAREANYTQHFMGHPSHYRLTPPLVSEDQSNTHQLAIADREPEPTDHTVIDSHIAQTEPSSSSHYRAGSVDPDIFEAEFPTGNQLTTIVNQVTIAIATRKSYQTSRKMRAQFCRFRKIPPRAQTDCVGWDGPFLISRDGIQTNGSCSLWYG